MYIRRCSVHNKELLVLTKQLDKIISSKDKNVRETFKELLIMATLLEDDGDAVGPLANMLSHIESLELRLANVELRQAVTEPTHMHPAQWWGNTPTSAINPSFPPTTHATPTTLKEGSKYPSSGGDSWLYVDKTTNTIRTDNASDV